MKKGVQKKAPIGVKIISIYYYILFALILILLRGVLYSALTTFFFLFVAVLGFFLGRGLWKGKNWSRIAAIIFSILGIVSLIYGALQNGFSGLSLIGYLINLSVGGYLIFNTDAKNYFKNKPK